MKLTLTAAQKEQLLAAMRASEDCEEAGDGSFTVDLYDDEPVISIELYPEDDGFAITAAVVLAYSEELDGYYLAEKLEDEAAISAIGQRILAQFL